MGQSRGGSKNILIPCTFGNLNTPFSFFLSSQSILPSSLPGVLCVVVVVLLLGVCVVVVKYHKKVGRSHDKELVSYSVKKYEEGDSVGRFSAINPVTGT